MRKSSKHKFQGTEKVQSARYCCSKEGVRKHDKRDINTKTPRPETRCGCEAHMAISFSKTTQKYRIHAYEPSHNHTLQPPKYVYMLPSHRKISEVQGIAIFAANDVGLRLRESHELMAKHAGDIAAIGFTKVDHNNFLLTRREKSMQYGEG